MSRVRLLELGVDEVCFGDTIGVGVPDQVTELTAVADRAGHRRSSDRLPLPRHARHGARQRRRRARRPGSGRFDASTGGTGGCPYAPGAAGNLATEDLVYLLDALGLRARRRPRRGARRRALHRRRPRQGRSPRRSVRPAAGTPRPAPRPGAPESAEARSRHARAELAIRPATMNGVVLVLNQNYEPLERLQPAAGLPARVRREGRGHRVRPPGSPDGADGLSARPRSSGSSTTSAGRGRASSSRRREVFARDRHTCQYCGRQTHDLTLDHVVPAPSRRRPLVGQPRRGVQDVQPPQGRQDARGGTHSGSRRAPFEPRSDLYSLFTPYLADERNEAWRTYLFLGRN